MNRNLFKTGFIYGIYLVSLVLYWSIFVLRPELHAVCLQGEDRLVEWLTFLFFFSASVLSFLTLSYRHTMSKSVVVYFLFLGIFLFVCAGEEISWGQRILGFETPENMMVSNEQKEFNLHNMDMKYLHPQGAFSFLMSFYGIVLPVFFLKRLLHKDFHVRRYISPLVLIPCFLFPVLLGPADEYIKSIITRYTSSGTVGQYGNLTKELREMYWGFSVFLSSMMLYRINQKTGEKP